MTYNPGYGAENPAEGNEDRPLPTIPRAHLIRQNQANGPVTGNTNMNTDQSNTNGKVVRTTQIGPNLVPGTGEEHYYMTVVDDGYVPPAN